MAQTEEQAPPRTIRVDGGSGPTLSWEYPPGVAIDVESVYAEIDASGAGDTTATVTVHDPSGVVIARKAQSQPIAGGAPGSATWALRLADDGAGGIKSVVSADPELWTLPPAGPTVAVGRFTIGAWLERDAGGVAQSIATDPFLGNSPVGLRHNRSDWHNEVTVDLVSNPSRLVIVRAGLYLITTNVAWLVGNFPNAGIYTAATPSVLTGDCGSVTGRVIASKPNRINSVGFAPLGAGDYLIQSVAQDTGGPIAAPLGSLTIVRLGPLP